MYPTIVILLIENQRSMVDVCEISPSNASKFGDQVASESRPATLGHLSFAARPVHSIMDSEAESQRSPGLQSQDGEKQGLEEDILEVKENQVSTSGWLTPLPSLALQH